MFRGGTLKAAESSSPDAIQLRILLLDDRGLESQHISDLVDKIKDDFKSVSSRTGVVVKPPVPEITDDPSKINYIIKEDENLPDLILCDLNLSKRGEGLEVARKIAKQHYPTDVLLYSYGGGDINEKINNIPSRYGVVLIANEPKIVGYTEWLVWRTIVKLSDPEYMRGLILSRATDTERIIDECLTDLFNIKDKLKSHFKMGLLRSEGNGPIQKYKLLRLAMEDLELIEKIENPKRDETLGKLQYIIGIRNLVAHGKTQSDLRGGLKVQNRLGASGKKGDSNNSDYTEEVPRGEIKRYLHKCFKEDAELLAIHEIIKNAGTTS